MTQIDDHPEDLLVRVGPDWARSTDALQGDAERDVQAAAAVMAAVRRAPSGRRIRYVWGLAAAAVLVAGAAGAQYVRRSPFLRAYFWTAPITEPSVEPSTTDRPKRVAPAAPVAEAVAPSPAVEPDPPAAAPAVVAPAVPAETAGQLFSEANDLRRSGKGAQSIPLYRKLQKLFPGSPQAEISYATLGSLLVEQGRPQEALGQFDHYVERGGPLLEDVLAGKASALARLGRSSDERRTWETLVSRFPSSVYAGRAKARLAELP